MAELEVIRAVFLDDAAETDAYKMFGHGCTDYTELESVGDTRLMVRSEKDPDRVFEQMSTNAWTAHALILDVNFENHASNRLRLADRCADSKTDWGLDILETIKRIDPDFPVVMLTSLADQATPFQAGRVGADEFISKSELMAEDDLGRRMGIRRLVGLIRRAMKNCRERSIYDHDHLAAANKYAQSYDVAERKRLATLAYYHYENGLISRTSGEMLKNLTEDRPLRILDIGCGTGRVEEFLGRSPLRNRLDVAAIDFSGAMLRAHHKIKFTS